MVELHSPDALHHTYGRWWIFHVLRVLCRTPMSARPSARGHTWRLLQGCQICHKLRCHIQALGLQWACIQACACTTRVNTAYAAYTLAQNPCTQPCTLCLPCISCNVILFKVIGSKDTLSGQDLMQTLSCIANGDSSIAECADCIESWCICRACERQ